MPERRCLITGENRPADQLLRFIVAPDGTLTPDLKANLPGRGYWLTPHRVLLDRARDKGLFQRAAKRHAQAGDPPLHVPDGLADQVSGLMRREALSLLGLANKAGLVTCGFEKVRAALGKNQVAALVQAADAAADGRRKLLQGLDWAGPAADALPGAELSLALGRENVVHAALAPGALSARFLACYERLVAFEDKDPAEAGEG